MSSEPLWTDADETVMHDLREQARTAPKLAAGEQAALLRRSADGDRQSQSRLVASQLGMVIRLAESRREKGLSVPDLVQEGSLGLVEAVRVFAAGGEDDFATFAERMVGEQMDAALAAEAAAVREAEQLVTAATDYERVEVLLRRALRRAPTEAEIAQKLEWTVERTRYVGEVVAEARRRHDEELLAFVEPDAIDVDDVIDAE